MWQSFLFLAALAFNINNASTVRESPTSRFELIILHHNDVHANFEQISRVATVVKEYRRASTNGGPPVLYLNVGDTYTEKASSSLYKWRLAADLLNYLRPEALSLGNGETATDDLEQSQFLANISVPILASNVMLSNNKTTQIKKSIVLNIAGVKVGIIGYLHPSKILLSQKDVVYIDEVEGIKLEASKLKSEGVKFLIALGHSSPDKDIEIATEVENIDLVIGGSTNVYFWNGLTSQQFDEKNKILIKQQQMRKMVPIVESNSYFQYLGKIHIFFDTNDEVVNYENIPILINKNVSQDNDAIEIINHYNNRDLRTKPVDQPLLPLDGKNCGREECILGNLITDAMLIINSEEKRTLPSAAIIHSGYIASSITPNAIIDYRYLYNILPRESTVVAVTINGKTLNQVLEHSISNYDFNNPSSQFLQFSGIKVLYDLSKPIGSRLVSSFIRCSLCHDLTLDAIDDFATYVILMPSVLSQGENGYYMLVGLPKEEQKYNEMTSLRIYIEHRNPIPEATEDRITLMNPELSNNTFNVRRRTTRRPTATIRTTTRGSIGIPVTIPTTTRGSIGIPVTIRTTITTRRTTDNYTTTLSNTTSSNFTTVTTNAPRTTFIFPGGPGTFPNSGTNSNSFFLVVFLITVYCIVNIFQ